MGQLGEDAEEVGVDCAARCVLSPRRWTPGACSGAWRTAAEDAGVLVFQADRIDVDEMRGFSISDRPLPAVVLNMQDAPHATHLRCCTRSPIFCWEPLVYALEELGPNTQIKRVEVFCNHVAGAALVPARSLLGEPEVPKKGDREIADGALVALARRYGVSAEVIVRRLLTLGRVNAAFYRRKRRSSTAISGFAS